MSPCVSKRTRCWITPANRWGGDGGGGGGVHHYVSAFLGLHVQGTWGKGGVLTIDKESREIHHFLDEFMIGRSNRSAEVFRRRLGNFEQALLDVIYHGIIGLFENGVFGSCCDAAAGSCFAFAEFFATNESRLSLISSSVG
jgi:hypothetical protein